MKASEYLQLRRDELAFSDEVTWVPRVPTSAKEACLLIGGQFSFEHSPHRPLEADKGYQYLSRLTDYQPGYWSDCHTLLEVLDLLDNAILLAKEEGN